MPLHEVLLKADLLPSPLHAVRCRLLVPLTPPLSAAGQTSPTPHTPGVPSGQSTQGTQGTRGTDGTWSAAGAGLLGPLPVSAPSGVLDGPGWICSAGNSGWLSGLVASFCSDTARAGQPTLIEDLVNQSQL